MKRHGYLFEKAFTYENLYQAYLESRKSKRNKKECFKFEINLGANIKQLLSELHNGTYSPKPYYKFTIKEPKPRTIYAPAFRDTVVQHAIYRIIYPIFDKTFINTSFACRVGYGTHRASNYIQKQLKNSSNNDYILKLDVKKFFYSIDRKILKSLLEKKIKDKRFIDVLIMFNNMDADKGIPIGNLLSQLYALIYLNPVDHYIKRILKVESYARYVDDMVLVLKDNVKNYKTSIENYLKNNLNLELSKFSINKVSNGINFVGYRTWRNIRLIRKYSLYNFFRKVKKNNIKSMISILGHARNTLSLAYMLRGIDRNNLPKFYREFIC